MGSSLDRYLQKPGGEPPSADASPLDSYLERSEQGAKTRLTLSVTQPPAGERAARVMRLQERTRLPTEVIERNLDAIEAEARRTDFDPDEFRRRSPVVARWLAESPQHHQLAGDDMDALSRMESLFVGLAGVQNLGRSFRAVGGFRRGRKEAEAGRIASEARDLGGLEHLPDARRHRLERLEREIAVDQPGIDFIRGSAKIIGQMVESIPHALASGLAGASTGAALAAAGGPAILAAPFAAGAGFTVGMTAGFAREAYILEGGHQYVSMRRMGVEHDTAANVSHGVGILNAMLETTGLAMIAKPFKSAAQRFIRQSAMDALTKPTMRQAMNDFGRSYLTGFGGELGTEAIQELVSFAGDEIARMGDEGAFDDPSQYESLWSRLASVMKQTAEGMALLALPGASIHGASTAYQARKAQGREQFYLSLGETIAESKTFARLPRALQDVVQRAQEHHGGAIDNQYVEAEQFVTYFQSKKIDPARVAEDLGVGEQLAEALESGGMLSIPTSRYATVIAPTEHNAFFAKELRNRPTEMNAREANDFLDALREAADETAAEPSPEDQSAATIGTQITAQLRAAGFNEKTAENYAKLYSAAFRTLGKRTGRDPMELFQRYGLRVDRPRTMANPAGVKVSLADVAARALAHREAQAEQAAERAAMEPTPYDIARDQRDANAKNDAGELLYPRTGSGVLRGNLAKVSIEGLIDELAFLSEAQMADRELESRFLAWNESGEAALVDALPDAERTGRSRRTRDEHGNRVRRQAEDLPDADGTMDPERLAAMRAVERDYHKSARSIEARKKAVARIEAELARRGVEDYHERLFKKMAGDESIDFDPTTFEQSAINRYVALASAAADERLSDDIRAEAARRAADIEASARAEYQAQIDTATREYAERYGEEAAAVFNQSAKSFAQAFPGGERPRGQISFNVTGDEVRIDLLDGADLSTFLHETGHFYLEVLRDLASQPDAPLDLVTDFETVKAWVGWQDGQTAFTREQHEKWARGFERYLMEGKAPSAELRGAFGKFRAWLVGLYRSIGNLNVFLTDDVRQVMDRLLATDDEITAAEQEIGAGGVAEAMRKAGLSEEKIARIAAAEAEARSAAEAYLTVKTMAGVQREQDAVYQAEYARVRLEVAAEVNQERDWMVLAFLQRGTKPDGTPLDLPGLTPVKLAKAALLAYEGQIPNLMARLRSRFLYVKDGGEHPDIVAEWFGFSSGDELLRTLVGMQGSATQRIDQLTRERMADEDPNLVTADELPEEALKAVHNEKRGQLHQLVLETLAAEDLGALKTAVRGVARRMAPLPEVRAEAERMIARRTPKDIQPIVFQRAEQKAARLALEALLKGDLATAFDEKLKEQLNHELYRAAAEARETIDKVRDEVRDLFQKDEHLAERRDMDLVNAARAIAASFGIGTRVEDPAFYLGAMQEYDPDTYEGLKAMVDAARSRGPKFDESSYADILAMREAVRALWDLALRTRQIEIDGKRMDLAEVRALLNARIGEIGVSSTAKRGLKSAVTEGEKRTLGLLGVRAALRRVEHWADAMDGGKPDGVFRRFIVTPIMEATAKYRVAKGTEIRRYLAIVKAVESTLTRAPIHAPEINYTFNGKAELLGALLHVGNDSNFDKLTRGRGWSPDAFDTFIRRMQAEGLLVKADYDYAQAVWDLFKSLKPAAQQAHRAMYGRYFDEITARPVSTPWGEYPGGYVPARPDPFIVTDSAVRAEKEALEQGGNGFMFPSTGRGFTKSRVDEYARPLWLDLRFVPVHIDAVLRFIHIQPRVKDVARIVHHREFRAVLDALDPAIGSDMLVPWLQRTATQKVEAPMVGWGGRAAGNFFRELRRRVGMNIMVGNVVNVLQQFTGFALAHVKVRPRYMRNALWTYVRSPKATVERIHEASEFMRTRQTTQVMEIQSHIDDLLLDPSKYEQARDFARKHGYFLQAGAQNVVDTLTWVGAYEQAVEQGANERDAVRQADAAVRLTQGSFAPEDISRFETGTPFARAFTMFYGYFNMQANLQGSEFSIARQMGLRKGAGRMLYAYVFGFMITAVLAEAIVQAADGEIDDDDDGYMDDILSIFFGGQFRNATAFVPVLGPIAQGVVNSFNDKWYDDRISTSPAVSAIESVVRAPKAVYEAIRDREGFSRRDVKDLLTLMGLLSGLPLGALARPLGYLADEERDSTGPLDAARGLITGKPRQ